MDFKESGIMYAIAAVVICFVIVQSVFFIVKAWKRGKELGITKETLKNTVISSALFSVAPALSILTTVIVLASALGLVLPWIRLSVIGNLAYETVAAQSVLDVFGVSLSTEVTDQAQFGAVAWVMTIGSCFPLVLLPFLCKLVHKKVGAAVNKGEGNTKATDALSAAPFIGIIAAFVARAINGKTSDGVGDAGFMSICVLLSAIVLSLVLETLCTKYNLKKLQPFAMPLSMFGAMGIAILLNMFAPENLVSFTWWG